MLPQLLGAFSARGWIDFKTEITKVGSLLSQMLLCRRVVQSFQLSQYCRMTCTLWTQGKAQLRCRLWERLGVSVLPQLLGAFSARRWTDFKTEITKIGNLLSQMLPSSQVVQCYQLNVWPWLFPVLLLSQLLLLLLALGLLREWQLMDPLLPLWCLKFPLAVCFVFS